MDFELNDEQAALQNSLTRLLSERHDRETRRRIAATPEGFSAALWQQGVELGLCALPVVEESGGLGGTAIDVMVVMQAFGSSMLASPWLDGCVLPVAALQAAGADSTACQRWLSALAAGATRLAWAHDEPAGDGGAAWVCTRATRRGAGWVLDGLKGPVHHGTAAPQLLVSARLTGDDGDASGRALFVLAADAPGVRRRALRLVDGTPACELQLQGAVAEPLVLDGTCAAAAIDAALAAGMAATCAERIGLMETAQRLTIEYLQTRQQFGRAIGQNQALRHALAEMQVSLELSRSAALLAAAQATRLLAGADEPERRADLHRAMLVTARHARTLTEAAIQLHGGIGMTEEYPVGQTLRRVLVLETRFGDPHHHAARIDGLIWPIERAGTPGSSV